MITPAISVLSATEGLQIIAPAFADMVIPATVVILAGLFLFSIMVQHAWERFSALSFCSGSSVLARSALFRSSNIHRFFRQSCRGTV